MIQLIRAEWTKLRSVPRWTLTLFGIGALMVGLSVLVASVSSNDANAHPNFVSSPDGRPVADEFHFVQQPLTGDGTITVRVLAQTDSAPWAQAGLMVKESLQSGSRYASLAVTPKHGVHLQANFAPTVQGGTGPWLRLTRTGNTITGYESNDGAAWKKVGDVTVAGLPSAVHIGFYVSSPPKVRVVRKFGSVGVGENATISRATFDSVSLNGNSAMWTASKVRMVLPDGDKAKPPVDRDGEQEGMTEAGGVFTVIGSGEIGPKDPPDDVVQISLFGVVAGLLALIPIGVLFVTSEYRREMIRTTFAATPRRGRVLAAKAFVLGFATFVIGLIGGAVAFLIAQPLLRDNGFRPPAFPEVSLWDREALQAITLTALFMAAMAVFSVGVGVIVRRSAAAVTIAIVSLLLPMIVSAMLPGTVAQWLVRLTPAGGFATQRVKPPSEWLVEAWSMISPWSGLATVCACAAVSMTLAWWLLRRRDA